MEEPGHLTEEPELKRRLMGYSPEDVQKLLADREQMLTVASDSVRQAETRIAELERELETARMQTPPSGNVEALESTLAEAREQLQRTQDEAARSRAELEQARNSLAEEERRRLAAEDRASGYLQELDELRQDLLSARRDLVGENERARSAESRLAELTAELEASQTQLRATPPPITDPSTVDEVANVLHAAEEVVSRVMEEGRARAQQELEDVRRELELIQQAKDEARAEIDRLVEWRELLAPQVEVVRSAIEDARVHAMRFGERIQEAVHPITSTMQVLGERLEALTEVGAVGPAGHRNAPEPGTIEADSDDGAPTTEAPTMEPPTTEASTTDVGTTDAGTTGPTSVEGEPALPAPPFTEVPGS